MRTFFCHFFDSPAGSTHRTTSVIRVSISGVAGYTQPTSRDLDRVESELTSVCHDSLSALREAANGTWFESSVEMDSCKPASLPARLRESVAE